MKKICRKLKIVLAGTLFLTVVLLCGCANEAEKESEDNRTVTEHQISEASEEQQKEEQQPEGLVRTTFLSEDDMALADM